jgi:hypothetical protein
MNSKINIKPNDKYNFLTSQNVINISDDVIKYAENILPRNDTIIRLNNYINDLKKSTDIESSIFEYSFIYCYNKNFTKDYIKPIYIDKLNNLLLNIDTTSYLDNQTLLDDIVNNKIDCLYIAFLSPHQIHPEKWIDIIKKNDKNEISKNNFN